MCAVNKSHWPNDVAQDMADAWSNVYEFCRQLGAREQPTGKQVVERFILDLHEKAQKYDRLIGLIRNIADDEQENSESDWEKERPDDEHY